MSISASLPSSLTDEQRIFLNDVDWDTYCVLRGLAENRAKRMIYDRGFLEIMTLSSFHERIAHLIARYIEEWSVARNIAILGCGSMTFQSAKLARALEPDKCYYVHNENQVRERQQLDLTIDPAPDLVVEVDHHSGSLDKMPIYAAMGVAEIWRWYQETLTISVLINSTYQDSAKSVCLPGFPIQLLNTALSQRHQIDETSLIREFRDRLATADAQSSK